MIAHSSQGYFHPVELKRLQAIFDEVVTQPWFPDSAEARDSFARFLFDTFHASGLPQSAADFEALITGNDATAQDDDIETILPRLRLVARSYIEDKHAADRLVERTLEYALKEVSAKSPALPIRKWLIELLRRTHASEGAFLAN